MKRDLMRNPVISIVIPTKNSEKTIEQCLESIKNQNYGNYEIILVDGLSNDNTCKIAAKFTPLIFTDSGSLPEARNIGFSKAKGNVFISIDSDMILEKTVLEDVANKIKKFNVLIISEVGYGSDFISKCKDLEKRCYIRDQIMESSRVFSKAAFLSVGGYDPNLHFAEDWDLHDRLKDKFEVGRIPSKVMHNTSNLSLIDDLAKAFKYGKSFPRYQKKNSVRRNKWLSVRNFFIFRHFKKLVHEPILASGLIVLKGTEYVFGLLGYLSAKIGL